MRRKMGKIAGLPVMMVGAVLLFASQANADARVDIGNVSGAKGSTVPLDVILVGSTGEEIAASQNDITYTANARIPGFFDDDAGGVIPDCAVNSTIRKNDTQFAFLPADCATGTGPNDVDTSACTAVRALVLSLANTFPIAGTDSETGTRIYTCNVAIGAAATGVNALTCSNEGASDPDGGAIATTCTSGSVTVVDATATATATSTPPPATPTNTSAVTNTPVNTATRTRGAGDNDDDGCQVVAPVSSHTGWLLFAPAALLLWSRRRSR